MTDTPAVPLTVVGAWRHTAWFCATYYALAFVSGLRNVYFWRPTMLDLLVPIALYIALAWWALVDARRRREPIPMLARHWFFFGALVLVPAYAIWSRGWRGVGWVALHAVGWYLLLAFTMLCAGTLLFGPAWWLAVR